jgi:hypothetical protein
MEKHFEKPYPKGLFLTQIYKVSVHLKGKWQPTPETLPLRRQKQDNLKFEARLHYIVRSCLKKIKSTISEEREKACIEKFVLEF